MRKILTDPGDIRKWVTRHDGQPAISTIRDAFGAHRHRLALAFRGKPRTQPGRTAGQSSPCSWSAWLAEFDRQNLALELPEGDDADAANIVERR